MEILDRYLHAVEFWLPKTQKQDIIAELSEDIRSQIEERESALGRKLNDPELEAMLKQKHIFFVTVGAGHLTGPLGVPALLRKDGYKVDGP